MDNTDNLPGRLTCIEKEEYIEFKSYKEANNYGYKRYKEWAEKYKEIVKITGLDVVSDYAGFSHRQYNNALRTENKNAYIDAKCEVLKYVIASAPTLGRNLVLYRSCCEEEVCDTLTIDVNGAPIIDKGFLSTSLLFSEMQNQNYKNILKIYASSATHAIYMAPISGRTECEVLIYPENHKLISAAPYIKGEYTIYECLLVTKK